MDSIANGAETISCPHCGNEMRRGMIRCRECGQSIVETDSEFVLNGHELRPNQDPKCPLCGAVLEPGVADCAACTSALLDQLLNGPGEGQAAAPDSDIPRPSSAPAKLHVHRASEENARGRMAPDNRQVSPAQAGAAVRSRRAKTANGKGTTSLARGDRPVPQFASPSRPAAPRNGRPSSVDTTAPEAVAELQQPDSTEEDLTESTTVETNAACIALLASLVKADAQLRCEIATALGKLGDKEALVPLERHLCDQDIRVRRAVAAALVQLGHPKGQTLLDIAERKPAASVLTMAKPVKASKPRMSTGGGVDAGTLKLVGGAVVAIAVVGGGIWYWMNSTPDKPARPARSAAARKAASAAAKPGRPVRKPAKAVD